MGSTVDLDPILERRRAPPACASSRTRRRRTARSTAAAASARSATSAASRSTRRRTSAAGATAEPSSPTTPTSPIACACCARTASSPRYHHQIVGTTARLDALQAAILRVKLRRLDGWNDDRRRLGAALREGLAGTAWSCPRPPSRAPTTSTTCSSSARTDREALREHLAPARRRDRGALPLPDPPDRGVRRSRPRPGSPAGRRAARRADLHAAAVPDDVRRRAGPASSPPSRRSSPRRRETRGSRSRGPPSGPRLSCRSGAIRLAAAPDARPGPSCVARRKGGDRGARRCGPARGASCSS